MGRMIMGLAAGLLLGGCAAQQQQQVQAGIDAVERHCDALHPPDAPDAAGRLKRLTCFRDGIAGVRGAADAPSYSTTMKMYSDLLEVWRRAEAGSLSFARAEAADDRIRAAAIEKERRQVEAFNRQQDKARAKMIEAAMKMLIR
jgi:hypothetical protein